MILTEEHIIRCGSGKNRKLYKKLDAYCFASKNLRNYTSCTNFFDGEATEKENYDRSRRVKRGLFRSNEGKGSSSMRT